MSMALRACAVPVLDTTEQDLAVGFFGAFL